MQYMLVRTDLSVPWSNIPSGNCKCGGCQQYIFMHKTQTFNHPYTGKIKI